MSTVVEITDLSAPELDVFTRLTEAQLCNRREPEKGVFIAESPKVIACALDEGYRPVSMLMERDKIGGQAREIIERCGDVPVYTADREVLSALTGYTLSRGVLCAMRRPAPRTLEAVCAGARRLAVLDGVVDATNVGAIFRSAAALGVDGVLVTHTCCDPYNRRAVRVSMGAVCKVPWTAAGGAVETLAALKELGFRTAAMALSDNSVPVDDPALKREEKLAVVLGAEGDGLPERAIAACDYTVKIPMFRGVDSLNVAAASAVAFWELRAR